MELGEERFLPISPVVGEMPSQGSGAAFAVGIAFAVFSPPLLRRLPRTGRRRNAVPAVASISDLWPGGAEGRHFRTDGLRGRLQGRQRSTGICPTLRLPDSRPAEAAQAERRPSFPLPGPISPKSGCRGWRRPAAALPPPYASTLEADREDLWRAGLRSSLPSGAGRSGFGAAKIPHPIDGGAGDQGLHVDPAGAVPARADRGAAHSRQR